MGVHAIFDGCMDLEEDDRGALGRDVRPRLCDWRDRPGFASPLLSEFVARLLRGADSW